MPLLHHLDCVKIISPLADKVVGHCLLLEEKDRLILIDTGIGLADTLDPVGRIGQELIDLVGYHFDEKRTAIAQIKKLGLDPARVTDCIITHLDNDHIGGLADFPSATVHVSEEEYNNYLTGNPRYLKTPLEHNPVIKTYGQSGERWFGLEARKININIATEIFFIPLFGHTCGHCGVALELNNDWYLHAGDAYYLNSELKDKQHPVNKLAELRADDNAARVASLEKIRVLQEKYPEINIFSYHDGEELLQYKN